MEIFLFVLLLIFMFLGLVSLVFSLPGNFIILAACVLYGWYGGFGEITLNIILILGLLAVLGEAIEFVLGILGAKKWKSSNKGIIGSIVGGIIGAILGAPFFFGIGALIGGFSGAFLGCFIVEKLSGKNIQDSVHSGFGAFVGKLGGMVTKGIIGCAMIIISIVSIVQN